MISYAVFFAISLALFVIAAVSPRMLAYTIAGCAGIPVTLFISGFSGTEAALGGLGAQAVYLLIIFSAMLLGVVTTHRRSLKVAIKFPLFIAFIIFCSASIAWSENIAHGMRFLIKLVSPLLMMMLCYATATRTEFAERLERSVLICCGAVMALSFLNYAAGGIDVASARVDWSSRSILTAPYMSPANYSFLMASGAILSLNKFMSFRRAIHLALCLVFSACVFLAFTRISIGGLSIALTCSLFLLSKSNLTRILLPLALIIGLVSSFALYEPLRQRMFFSGSSVDISTSNVQKLSESIDTSGRTLLWERAFKKFDDNNILIGAGLGSVDGWLADKLGGTRLHSEYLRLYFDVGLIGLSLYVLFLIFCLIKSISLLGKARTKQTKYYASLSISMLIFFSITLFTDNSLNYVTELGFYVFIPFALLFSSLNRNFAPKSVIRPATYEGKKALREHVPTSGASC